MKATENLSAWLEDAVPRLLPGFFPACRWFAGKARLIEGVDFEDAAWLADDPRPCALAIVGVRYAEGPRERYVLLLAFVEDRADLAVVGACDVHPLGPWLVEAATDPAAAMSLLSGFVAAPERPTLRGGTLRYGDVTPSASRALAGAPPGTIRALGTEQSNTSLRVDRALVFKLFRRLEAGENPELEVGRFLSTRTNFRATPVLHGSLTYAPAEGASSTLGVLQQWIDNRGDGWRYVVDLLRHPDGETHSELLLRDLALLGATTADFHVALATGVGTPAFSPEPVVAGDVEHWQTALRDCAARAFALVERGVQAWPPEARQLGQSLLGLRGDAVFARAPGVAATSAQFHKIRVHGDYHLGQTLKTDEGFIVIDLEGEPSRPLAERRQKQCALKDVAGMIRSFDYAVETARALGLKGAGEMLSAQRLRKAFLDGYCTSAAAHGATFLPEDRHALDAWIDFFEAEKAFYELAYEINNRPDWVHIPLRGLLRILDGRP